MGARGWLRAVARAGRPRPCRLLVLRASLCLASLAASSLLSPRPARACPGELVVLEQRDPAPPSCAGDPSCPTDAGYARRHAAVCLRDTTLTTATGECTLRLAHPVGEDGEWPGAGPRPFVVHAHGASQLYTGYDELLTHWAANGIVSVSWANPFASVASDATVGDAAAALLECVEALRLGVDAPASGDPWTPADASELDTILGLSGHSFGGATVREAARFLRDAESELELRAVALLAPRRVASPLQTAPRSYFNHDMSPALLVIGAGLDDDVPDDAHPYADRSTGEGSFFGGEDVRTTVSFVWAPRARHQPFERLDDPDEDDPRQRLLARAFGLALFELNLLGDDRFASRLRGEIVDASLDANASMPLFVSYMQGSRVLVDGGLADSGQREVIANFEPGDPERGAWSLAEGAALELVHGPLASLDIGRAYFDGALDDQASCEDSFEGADACPLPLCGPCQSYANRHLGEDGASTSGLRLRYAELDGPQRLLIDVPEHLRDFGDAQILSLEVAVSYLDTRNLIDGVGQAKDLRVGLLDARGRETELRRLSEFGPRTLAGEASAASPATIPYPAASIHSASGLMGEQDLTITTLRTYRVGLGELCEPGFDAGQVAAIVLELDGLISGASGALLLDGVALERSPGDDALRSCGDASPPTPEGPGACACVVSEGQPRGRGAGLALVLALVLICARRARRESSTPRSMASPA